jgi:hypothetical protein
MGVTSTMRLYTAAPSGVVFPKSKVGGKTVFADIRNEKRKKDKKIKINKFPKWQVQVLL